jgi:arylsulfatase A-like enzyme
VERVAADGEGTPLERTVDAARAALRRMPRRGNWLLWVDLATALPPWDVPPDFRDHYFQDEPDDDEDGDDEEGVALEPLTPHVDPAVGPIDPEDDTLFLRLQGSYAGAVTYLDAGVGQLVEAVRALGDGDEVAVLVTADAGFPLGEHGAVGPSRAWPHNELVQLPLIARLPGGDEAGRRVAALTQAVDLAPTLADVFDAPFGPAHGRTLVPLMQGEAESVRPYAVSGLQAGDKIGWSLRTPGWAFLLPVRTAGDEPARPRLFVRPDDRSEVNDVLQHHLEWADAAERTLREFVAATRQPGPLEVPPLPDPEAGPQPETPTGPQ